MEIGLIYEGVATVGDLMELNEKKGFEFIIEDGAITNVLV